MAKKPTQPTPSPVKEAVNERQALDKVELFRKEKDNIPMTYAELEALQREKAKELSNQILRIFGLFTILAVIVFAVGTFLYPYSILNVFGNGDRFWDCWNNIQFHTGTVMQGETQLDNNGWLTLERIYSVAFQPNIPAKVNFIVLGAWSIVPICTIGLVGVVLVSAFLVAYNIRDLVSVIRHFIHRTGAVVSDVAISTVESVESAIDANGKKKRLKKAKAEEPIPAPEKKDDLELPEIDLDAIIPEDEPKAAEPAAEEAKAPKAPRRKEKADDKAPAEGLSSEQLDALLRGESIK